MYKLQVFQSVVGVDRDTAIRWVVNLKAMRQYLSIPHTCLRKPGDVLKASFSFKNSPEGLDYWNDVASNLKPTLVSKYNISLGDSALKALRELGLDVVV